MAQLSADLSLYTPGKSEVLRTLQHPCGGGSQSAAWWTCCLFLGALGVRRNLLSLALWSIHQVSDVQKSFWEGLGGRPAAFSSLSSSGGLLLLSLCVLSLWGWWISVFPGGCQGQDRESENISCKKLKSPKKIYVGSDLWGAVP